MKRERMAIAIAAAVMASSAPRRADADCSSQNGFCESQINNGASPAHGILASGNGGIGIEGNDTLAGAGVFGVSHGGEGVYGLDNNGAYGVRGVSTTSPGTGVYGQGYSFGVYGSASGTSSTGVYGTGTQYGSRGYGNGIGSYGVYGSCFGASCKAGYFSGDVTITGNLSVASCSGCTSDIRVKKNVEPISGALDKLLQLKGVTFQWTDPAQHENDTSAQWGFIAQEVEKVFPRWVRQDGYTAPDGQKYRTLELRQIEALEVESIRTLKAENDDLKARVKALEEGRRPVVSMNANGVGFGVGGLAVAAAIVVSRRKRRDVAPS